MRMFEDARLRDRIAVFEDREEAGAALARYLQQQFVFSCPLICPIPAGGVPIGVVLARALNAPLKLVIVRKIQIPWSSESGFGAITWDGDVVFNEELRARLDLTPEELETAISRARESVRDRIRRYARNKEPIAVEGSTVILTDDGLASGFTMQAAVNSIRKERPERVVVAVPTGSLAAVRRIASYADDVVCLNIRSGYHFAVADAYRNWYDLSEEDVEGYLDQIAETTA